MMQLCEIPDLSDVLEKLLMQIPTGSVTTYGDLAEALGSIKAARWVGEYLMNHEHFEGCSCHRVVRRTGEIGLYITRDASEKKRRLEEEGIKVDGNKVDLTRFRFTNFQSRFPLQVLTRFQHSNADQIRFDSLESCPNFVGGVDVSYNTRQEAVGTYALVEVVSGKLESSVTIRRPVAFPYIPGFLAFRELPVLLELLAEADRKGQLAALVLVDGNGVLHPRRSGIASCLGVLANLPTIGIAKSLLCGQVDLDEVTVSQMKPVVYEGEKLGVAVKSKENSRPIFVSPGHDIDLESAMQIVPRLFFGHRLPEPLFQADAISRRAAREVAEKSELG